MADLDKLVDELSKLSVLEAAELVKKLETTWGVSAAAPVATAWILLAGRIMPAQPLCWIDGTPAWAPANLSWRRAGWC